MALAHTTHTRVRVDRMADKLLLELRLETVVTMNTCIRYVFPNSLRQTLWTSMARWFSLRLRESIRKHVRSLHLSPPPNTMLPMCLVGGVLINETPWPRGMPTVYWGGSGGFDESNIRQCFLIDSLNSSPDDCEGHVEVSSINCIWGSLLEPALLL